MRRWPVGHGRSNARAVFSAIRAARDAVNNRVLDTLREVAKEIEAKKGLQGATEGDGE